MAGLEAAVRAGDAAGVKHALEVVGEDPDALGAGLDTAGLMGKGGALHLASFLGGLPVLEVLLHGAGAKRKGEGRGGGGIGGGGALRAALERGTTKLGATAHMCAAFAGQQAATVLLLDRGAELEARSSIGSTALMFAAEGGHTDTAALLVDRGPTSRPRTAPA